MLTFIAGGVACLASARTVTSPMRYVFAGLGAVALAALATGLFLLDWNPIAELGEGGIERWVAYPVVLWLVGYGSHAAAVTPRPATRSGGSAREVAEPARSSRH
jgi:hypothetical protein